LQHRVSISLGFSTEFNRGGKGNGLAFFKKHFYCQFGSRCEDNQRIIKGSDKRAKLANLVEKRYICTGNIIAGFTVNQPNILEMKMKFLTALVLIVMALVISSCYSSRKSGCPANPQSNYRFRG
jgi:hypothetical protein